jgi:ABC-type bacteriocin/lantibiotic exporter with double-glycine peptidase domain
MDHRSGRGHGAALFRSFHVNAARDPGRCGGKPRRACLLAECLTSVLGRYLSTDFARLRSAGYGETNETLASAAHIALSLVLGAAHVVVLASSLLSSAALLAFYDFSLSMLVAVVVSLITLLSVAISLRQQRTIREQLAASSTAHEVLHVLLSALPTLYASGATERALWRWTRHLSTQLQLDVKNAEIGLQQSLVVQVGQQVTQLFALAWMMQQALSHETTVGQLLTTTLLVSNVMRASLDASQTALSFVTLKPHWERVTSLFELSAESTDRETLSAQQLAFPQAAELRLENVSFRYDDQCPWVLSNHTSSFQSGKHAVLRAASGAGKSTMLRLLAGLLAPESGSVRVLGRDPRRYAGMVTYLPQQASLLEASIGTNLTTLSGAPLERALEVAKHTGLEQMLRSLPMGVETLVSAGGSNLSAGQRQLILLTAAFATSAPVLLLDEVVSQLDPQSQSRVNWSELGIGRTIVEVRH